jgi:hypothetical protein
MTPLPEDEPNPYQAPESELRPPVDLERAAVTRELVKKFRDQTLALGVLWIILGTATAAMGGIFLRRTPGYLHAVGPSVYALLLVNVVLNLVWVVLGVLTCMKQLGAVHVGLVLSYLFLLERVVSLNVPMAVILIAVILQAHRVIGWARQMRAASVPLTAKP